MFALSIAASPLLTLPLVILAPRRLSVPEWNLDRLPTIAFCAQCAGKVMRTAQCCLHCGAELPASDRIVPIALRQLKMR